MGVDQKTRFPMLAKPIEKRGIFYSRFFSQYAPESAGAKIGAAGAVNAKNQDLFPDGGPVAKGFRAYRPVSRSHSAKLDIDQETYRNCLACLTPPNYPAHSS
jgi:hypothetical protein